MPVSIKTLTTSAMPKLVTSIQNHLNAADKTLLYSAQEIAAELRCGMTSVQRSWSELPRYTMLHKGRRYWGNPAAIERANKEICPQS